MIKQITMTILLIVGLLAVGLLFLFSMFTLLCLLAPIAVLFVIYWIIKLNERKNRNG